MSEGHVSCGRHTHRTQTGADECVARRFDRLVRQGLIRPQPFAPLRHSPARRALRDELVVAVYQEDGNLPYKNTSASPAAPATA